MKLCKYHRQALRWVVEYAYNSGYDDGKRGFKKTAREREKEVRNIGSVQSIAFEYYNPATGSCKCDPTKFKKL